MVAASRCGQFLCVTAVVEGFKKKLSPGDKNLATAFRLCHLADVIAGRINRHIGRFCISKYPDNHPAPFIF